MMNKPVNQIEAAIEEHFGKENIDEQEQYETEMEEQYNKGYQKGYEEGLKDGKLEGHLALEKLRNSFTKKLAVLTAGLEDRLAQSELELSKNLYNQIKYENKDNN